MESNLPTQAQPPLAPNGAPARLRVILRSGAYAGIMRGARISTPGETVGALVGSVQDDNGWELIDVQEAVQIKLAASRSGLAPGQKELREIKASLAGREEERLRVVGWYYTHPAGEVDGSDIDVNALERAFGNDTRVTLLADPARGQGAFYARRNGRLRPIGEFSVSEAEGETLPGVIWSGVLPGTGSTTSAAYAVQASQTVGRVDVKISRSGAHLRLGIVAALLVAAFALGLWQGGNLLGGGKKMQSSTSLSVAALEVAAKATVQALKSQPTSVPLLFETSTPEATESLSLMPTLPPSPTPEPPAKTVLVSSELTHTLLLEDTDFTGGYTPENGKYRDRTARYLYGQGTPYNSAIGKFNLNLQVAQTPVNSAMVTLVGLASQTTASIPVRIELNGATVFEGPNPFPSDLGATIPGAGNWGTFSLQVKPEALRQGRNTLIITNLASGGQVGSSPYIVIDRAAVAWSTR